MKKVLDFIGHQKIFFGISIGIFIIGIICNFVFGAKLDIQFTGGAIVKYSYSGTVDETKLKDLLQKETAETVSFAISKNLIAGEQNADTSEGYIVSVQFPGNESISVDAQAKLTQALQKEFPDNSFQYSESNSVESTMGWKFFLKCLTAVAIASVLMVLYVTFRFKKISGLSAGVMALIALLHDVLMIYFTFVILRMPIDSNFIAVVLMILGYSLNDTIVIYDRVRENRGLMGNKTDPADLFNKSASQCLKRTICTSVTTFMAIACVYVISIIFNLTSVQTFALPMMVGVISGCYSSIFIAGPLWVMWQHHKAKKKAELRANARNKA